MKAAEALTRIILPGLDLLPERMNSPEARAMLLAIGLQESRWMYRRQMRGPARGYLQFEMGGGVHGVLHHRATAALAEEVCHRLDYEATPAQVYTAIEHNDPLATVFGRLLLWTLPSPLPQRGDVAESWRQYMEAWRPGRPHPDTWADFFTEAWDIVTAHQESHP